MYRECHQSTEVGVTHHPKAWNPSAEGRMSPIRRSNTNFGYAMRDLNPQPAEKQEGVCGALAWVVPNGEIWPLTWDNDLSRLARSLAVLAVISVDWHGIKQGNQ